MRMNFGSSSSSSSLRFLPRRHFTTVTRTSSSSSPTIKASLLSSSFGSHPSKLLWKYDSRCLPTCYILTTLRHHSTTNMNHTQVVRKQVSLTERANLRAARREQASKTLQQQRKQQQQSVSKSYNNGSTMAGDAAVTSASHSSSSSTAPDATTARLQFLSRYMWPLGLGIPTIIILWGVRDENSLPAQCSKAIGLTQWMNQIMDYFAKPAHDKLLPDWSMIPNVPHDMPPPHTLVLDLENTLVSSTWDRKHGWRHAKRPGVDKFLMEMAQYYEIVLYSPSHDGVADPVVTALDKSGCIMHRLYRDATYYKHGIHVKDLASLNRNVKRIIVLDDDPLEVQMHLDNLIRVKPYTDPNDFEDHTLSRITPFLIEIARENYQDIPALLRQYHGMDADQIADELDRRVLEYKQDRERHVQRGLVGLLSSGNSGKPSASRGFRGDLPPPELPPMDPYAWTSSSSSSSNTTGTTTSSHHQLTAKELVGSAPTSGSGGGLVAWLNRRTQEKEEAQKRKMEKWNEVMQKRHKEQQDAEKRKKETSSSNHNTTTAA